MSPRLENLQTIKHGVQPYTQVSVFLYGD